MDPQPPDEDLPPIRRPLRARWVLLILLLAALGAYLAYRQTDSYALKVLATYGIRIEITPDGVTATDTWIDKPPSSALSTLLDRIFPWREDREPPSVKTHDLERIAPLLHRFHVTSFDFINGNFTEVETLDALAAAPDLHYLELHGCNRLKNVKGLAPLHRLEAIVLHGTHSLQNLDGLDGLPALQVIQISYSGLQNIDALARVPNLRNLNIESAPALATLDGLSDHPALAYVSISECHNLQDIHALGTLPRLRILALTHCDSLQNLEPLLYANRLEHLSLDRLPVTDGKLLNQLNVHHGKFYIDEAIQKLMDKALREREGGEGALKGGVEVPEAGGDGLEEGHRSLE